MYFGPFFEYEPSPDRHFAYFTGLIIMALETDVVIYPTRYPMGEFAILPQFRTLLCKLGPNNSFPYWLFGQVFIRVTKEKP